MKKEMKIWQAGQIHINTNDLDVTDPGYDDDVWCRLHIKDMQPGTYNCMVKYIHEGADAKRHYRATTTVAKAIIYLADGNEAESVKQRVDAGRSWRLIGVIGVDSGQAGFFPGHKPNFDDSEWEKLVDWMFNRKDVPQAKDKPNGYLRKFDEPGGESFWTASGYGDGAYPVYTIHSVIGKKRMCTAVEIRFVE